MNPIRTPVLVLLAVVAASCSYVPFSGGALTGTPSPAPADWSTLNSVDIIQLETQPDDPYSVKLWMIAMPDRVYVYAGDNQSQWVLNMDQDPRVRLQVGDEVFELEGHRVDDEAEFDDFAKAWLEKYGSDRSDSTAAGTYLYGLTPR